MNTLIIPVSPTINLIEVTGKSSLNEEEQQLATALVARFAFDEQLMLDREAYYQDSQY
jgi:hypothetical protein